MAKKIIPNLLGSQGFNALAHGKHGYFLYNKNDIYVGKSMGMYGEWSEAEVLLLREFCHQGNTIIEVGSNIGTHTVPLARMVGPIGFVYAFEPQRLNYQTLCANVALNSLTNVEVMQAAVSDQQGIALMPVIDYNQPYNFGGVQAYGHQAGRPVTQITLDMYFGVFPSLHLIKADVERMELNVLKGAAKLISVHRPLLYLENEHINGEVLVAYVMSLGYRVYKHVVHLFNPHNHAQIAENHLGNFASINIFCVPKEKNFAPPHYLGLRPVLSAAHYAQA